MAKLEQINIPGTSLVFPRVALGTWAIGGWLWGGTDEKESIRTIETALDNGINLIDTAPAYGEGLAEEIVGKAIKKYSRDQVYIATKAGLKFFPDGNVMRDASHQHLTEELDNSLKRLGTDYIDLYQLHWPDPKTPIEEVAETFQEFIKKGKIRAIGVSNFTVEQMKTYMKVAPIHTSQPPYNMFERDAEAEILPFCHKNDIATLLYGSLCRGLLTGKMSHDSKFSGDDLRNDDPKFQSPRFEQYLKAVEEMTEIARSYNKTMAQLAVRWVLQQPGCSIALWGARHPEQVMGMSGASGWTISDADLEMIHELLMKYAPETFGPDFMAPPNV